MGTPLPPRMRFLLHVIENFGNIPKQSLSKLVGNVIENNKSSFLRTCCVMKLSTVGNPRKNNFQPKNQHNLCGYIVHAKPNQQVQKSFENNENQHICLNEITNSKICIDLRFVGWIFTFKDSHFYCILGYRLYLDWLWLWENYRLAKQTTSPLLTTLVNSFGHWMNQPLWLW